MSREIKFRAWDEIAKDWEDDFHINPDGTISYVDAEGDVWPRNCILMQFTGLKDKNGVEVYEGDIIRRYGGGLLGNPKEVLATGQVCYYAPSFSIRCSKDGEWANMFNASELEVIGNIYETPELLEQKS